MDFMQQQIWKRVHDDGACRNLNQFMNEHDVDTDCFEDDIEIFGEEHGSNLHGIFAEDDDTMSHILSVWRHQKIMSKCFATGFQLLYWKWYRAATKQDMSGTLFLTMMDFGGYSPQELSVYPHHANLKEEVLATGLMGPEQFNDLVVLKASMYLESAQCRKMKCAPLGGDCWGDDLLHFGISNGSALCPEHIQSMVMYCDFTKLCTLFSKSLRKNKWNDELEDVKARNAKFYHFSKSLRELVTYFGSYGEDDDANGKVNGPFFSGVSVVLNISEFSIGFNTPTSTSKTLEIAWRFAGPEGMVITVGNSKPFGYRQPLFNATWISNFVEEDEYFWFGSIYKLNVEDIIIVASSRVYRRSMAALYFLDSLFTAQQVDADDVDDEILKIIDFCIRCSLDENNMPPKPKCVDDFVLDILYGFCQKKTKLLMNLYYFQKVPESLRNMIFSGFSSTEKMQDDMINIFRPDLFILFPHLTEILLEVNDNAMDFKSMLKMLEEAVIPESFEVLKLWDYDKYWMKNAFEAISDVQEQHRAKGWSIEHEAAKNMNADWIFIRKLL